MLLATGYAWLVASAPGWVNASHGPSLRVGIGAPLAQCVIAAEGGLLVQDAAGETLLDATRSLVVRVQRSPATEPAKPAAARVEVTAVDGDPPLERSRSLPLAPLWIRPVDANARITLGQVTYRGEMRLQPAGAAALRPVAILPLEEYLRGVVPAEMPASSPAEALKAQAVVARTFTLASLARHEKEGFDLCDGVHCQVYAGVAAEREATDGAIAATAGQILVVAGKPIDALYHAACGGATDGPARADVPAYLSGGPDAAAALDLEWRTEAGVLALADHWQELYCGAGEGFRWEKEFTREELERLFARTLPTVLGRPAKLGTLHSLRVDERAPYGRVRTLVVSGSDGTHTVRGESIRWLFGTGHLGTGLPSTRFVLRPISDPRQPEAPPERYHLTGFGRGHGVGLCQTGAIGRARRGATAAEILRHYFPGATLSPIGGTPAAAEE